MQRKLCTLVAILLFAAPVWAQTPQALEVVPEDALGFVLIKDIGQSSENLENLAKKLKIEERVSLTEMMQKVGQKGFNEKGSVAVLFLKADKERPLPAVVFALPVSDFQKVQEQLAIKDAKEGVNSAELTITSKLLIRMTGKGFAAETTIRMPILVAKKGNFALVTAGHNQAVLERLLSSKSSVAASLKPAQDFIGEQGIATVITQHGIKAGVEGLLASAAGANQPAGQAPTARTKTTLADIEKNVQLIAMGSHIDKEGHARHTTRVYFEPSGAFAKWASKTEPVQEKILARFPDQPYVVTLLAHLSPQTRYDIIGHIFDDLPAEKADNLTKSWAKMLQRVSDIGVCVYLDKPGEKSTPQRKARAQVPQ